MAVGSLPMPIWNGCKEIIDGVKRWPTPEEFKLMTDNLIKYEILQALLWEANAEDELDEKEAQEEETAASGGEVDAANSGRNFVKFQREDEMRRASVPWSKNLDSLHSRSDKNFLQSRGDKIGIRNFLNKSNL